MEIIKESDEEDLGYDLYIDLSQGDKTRDVGCHEGIDNEGDEDKGDEVEGEDELE